MKTRSKVFSATILFVLTAALTLVLSKPVFATTGNTKLTTVVPSCFLLDMTIEGNGAVVVNSENHTKSGTVQIARNAEIVLHILPAPSGDIQSVMYNGNDLTDDAQSGALTLPAMDKDSWLQIVFTEKQSCPQTGDFALKNAIAANILMVVSLLGFVVVLNAKKKKIS